MAIDSVASFVDFLRQNRLLPNDRLEELTRFFQHRFSDPRSLAKHLVQKGWMTVYQINRVFQGQAEKLVWGQYRILDRLGEGGVSQVFKAWDTRQERVVALKVIRQQFLDDPEAVGRFVREIKTVTRLMHPNIVQAFDASMAGSVHFLIMEYIEGNDLQKWVELSGPLPVAQACDYVRQTALGLQHAHERGLIHRDIKPANLLVAQPGSVSQLTGALGVVKILDLGLARLQQSMAGKESAAMNLTADGAIIGTADYLSPEQARDARSVDIRADIYSLGCTLYFLLAGQPPFPKGSALMKIFKHQEEEPTPIGQLRPEVPEDLGEVLRKMMAKKPEDRYQTPAELALAISPFSIMEATDMPQQAPKPKT